MKKERMEVMFTVNHYDRDGDITDAGVFLHFGPATIKVAETMAELEAIRDDINKIITEIKENYNFR